MRFIHCSDLHFGKELGSRTDPDLGLNLRVLDYFKAFDLLIEHAVKYKVDFVLCAGDVFNIANPPIRIQAEFMKRIKELKSQKIEFVCLLGNHDVPTRREQAHALTLFKETEMGLIIDNPSICKFNNMVSFGFVPSTFLNRSLPTRDVYSNVVANLAVMPGPRILVIHATVNNSIASNGMSLSGLNLTHPSLEKIQYVALGDIHKEQVIQPKPLITYCGSLRRTNHGEAKEAKGFLDVIIDDNGVNAQFVEIPDREFITEEINITSNPESTVQVQLRDMDRRSVLRLKVKLRPKQEVLFDLVALSQFFSYSIQREFVDNQGTSIIHTDLPVKELVNQYLSSKGTLGELTSRTEKLKNSNSEQILNDFDKNSS